MHGPEAVMADLPAMQGPLYCVCVYVCTCSCTCSGMYFNESPCARKFAEFGSESGRSDF